MLPMLENGWGPSVPAAGGHAVRCEEDRGSSPRPSMRSVPRSTPAQGYSRCMLQPLALRVNSSRS
jgi:hypothetical protein